MRIILKKDFTEFINTQPHRFAGFLTEMNDEQWIHFVNAAILYPADFSEIRRKWAGNNPSIIDQK